MKVDLAGKVAVVTGAASGVGAAVARQIAEAGAAGLVLTDRDGAGCAANAEAVALHGVEVEICKADLLEADGPARIINAAKARFERIDGLVNAAGLTTRAGVRDGSSEQWDSLFAVNARAPFFLMQGAVEDMVRRGAGGAIVNILSINAHCGLPELAIYSAAKGALLTLTKNAAHAHLADRIRVNGINLGWTLTDAEHRMQSETLGLGEDWARTVAAGLPLGRLLDPTEVARHVLFLLSEASAPMTGVVIDLEQKVTGA